MIRPPLKSLQKFRWFFLVDLKIPKNPFEINWPKALFSKNSKPERNLLLLLLDFLKGKSFTPPRSFLYISQWGEFNHYIEVARGAIFMGGKKKWDLSWFWASWQYWKKNFGPIMSYFWGLFEGKKKVLKSWKNIVASALKSCIISLLYA